MMKISTPDKTIFLYLVLIAFVVASCGSYQQTAYYSDGIYGNQAGYHQQTRVVQQPVTDNNQNYANYFAYKSQEYGALVDRESEVFTDIDSYSSTTVEDDSYMNDDYTYQGNGYAGWGESATNVYLTVVPAVAPLYGWGWNNWAWGNSHWNNWGWGNSYWNTRYWGPAGYYAAAPWGWNNWGYDPWNPGWGWNNGFYGASWGWNNWASGYGFYCPPSYTANGNIPTTRYVRNNSRRNSYSTFRNQTVYSNNSRRGYNNNYSSSSQVMSRAQRQGISTNTRRNYSVKSPNTSVKNYSGQRQNTRRNYSNTTRSNNYNNRSSTRRSSSGSYRSTSPSRSSGSSMRSSGSRSRSSGGVRRGRG